MRDRCHTLPKVSIVVPVFNAEPYLSTCLETALGQTLGDLEVICVDDCSTDSSCNIVERYAAHDSRVRCLGHQRNQGGGAARNTGLDAAKGEYVFHLDADDCLPINALELLVSYADKYGSDLVKGRFAQLYESGETKILTWSAPDQVVINTNIHNSPFVQKIPNSHCTYLYRRSFIEEERIRYRTDLKIGEDLVTLATALLAARAITLVPDLVYYYRQTPASAVRGPLSERAALDDIRMHEIISGLFLAHNMDKLARERLRLWSYVIRDYWVQIPRDLSPQAARRIFSAFRDAVQGRVVPWLKTTPHHHRYLLALILAERDEEAVAFLGTPEAVDGFRSEQRLKEALVFVLEQVSDDIGALLELGVLPGGTVS